MAIRNPIVPTRGPSSSSIPSAAIGDAAERGGNVGLADWMSMVCVLAEGANEGDDLLAARAVDRVPSVTEDREDAVGPDLGPEIGDACVCSGVVLENC